MRKLEISQAAAIASDWHGGQYSALYRFSCIARRHNGIDFISIRLVEQSLVEVGRCIASLTKDKGKNDFTTDFELRRNLHSLCLFRNFLNGLLLQKTVNFDTVLLLSSGQIEYNYAA